MRNTKYEKIKHLILDSSKIVIMAHRGMDLDALGSCLAFGAICTHFQKDNYIIVEDKENEVGVKRALLECEKRNICCKITRFQEIEKEIDEKTLLVILDTHKRILVMNPQLLDKIERKLIIDHHIVGEELIEDTLLHYIKKHKASTSEIIVDLLDYYGITIEPYIATVMLAGTQIDTNNFNIKTTEKTFLTASRLVKFGADTKEVGYLLKQDLYAYLKRQKIIENAVILKGKYAIGVGSIRNIYDKEELAKASDSLLLFDGIEASFTIGKIGEEMVGISARSLGNIDVQKIMEQMGGGGHATEAACQLEKRTIDSVREELVQIIKK